MEDSLEDICDTELSGYGGVVLPQACQQDVRWPIAAQPRVGADQPIAAHSEGYAVMRSAF